MKEPRTYRLWTGVGAFAITAALSGCSPFQADPGVMRELDAEVASWNLTDAGEVIAECSDSSSLGAQYSYTLLLRGDDAWEDVQQRFADAGFVESAAQDDEYGRVNLERIDPAREWGIAVNLVPAPSESASCGGFAAAAGDTWVDLRTTTKESR